jgi:hypothetical protein
LGKFKAPYTDLLNRINNIVDSNTDMTKSKNLINPPLGDCWRRREKLILIFFGVTSKTNFKKQFFEALLKML